MFPGIKTRTEKHLRQIYAITQIFSHRLALSGDRGQFPEVRFHTLGYANGAAAFALHVVDATDSAEL